MERTLVIVKPDGVQRGLIGPILGRLESRGLKLVGLKFLQVSQGLAEQHYAIHRDKPFFQDLVSFITSSPVVAAVLEGPTAVSVVRGIVGATNASQAMPGTIRGDWALDIGHNLVHASDSPENGQQEVALWFREDELVRWDRNLEGWING
ncbi:MAG TPA: nucleoside-diphosphate kinase [Chloroflexota bacterium]